MTEVEAPTYIRPRRSKTELTVEDMPPRSEGAEAIWLEVRDPDCARCELGVRRPAQQKTVCLTGDGPVPCDAMLVGEGPGQKEDALQRSFIGEAGEYLDNLLLDVGVDPSEVYKTNATKCLPPREKKDEWVSQAVKPCKDFLLEEVRRVRPKVILVMGNAALKSLTGMSGVLKKRGMEFYDEKLEAWIIVTVHPAAVFSSPNRHAELFADLQKFARRLRGEEGTARPEVVVCDTVEKVREALAVLGDEKTVTVDLETQGFDHWRPESKIWCAGLSADPGKAYLVPLEHPESPFVEGPDLEGALYTAKLAKSKGGLGEKIRGWLEQSWTDVARPELHEIWSLLRDFIQSRRLSGHNVKFDAIWLARRDIEADIWFDTMMAAHLLNENREMNLESLSMTELGVTGWGKRKVSFVPPDALEIMGPYCGCDTAYGHALYLKYREQLTADPELARLYQRVSLSAVRVFKKSELRGIWIDTVRAQERLVRAREERDRIDGELLVWVPEEFRERQQDLKKQGKSIFNSSSFLNGWLFAPPPAGLGLQPQRKTKTGWSTDKDTLKVLSGKHPAVDLLLARSQTEATAEFFESWAEDADPDDRVHPSFNLAGTVTGRKASGFHTVPREDTRAGQRSTFGATPDWTFIECDFSQVELRIAAWLAQEPTMLAIFRNGGDIHLYTAALVTGKLQQVAEELGMSDLPVAELSAVPEFNSRLNVLVTKDERRKAKAINFGFLYGMGASKFRIYALESYGVEVTSEEAELFRNSYFTTYDHLLLWHEQQRRVVQTRHRVVSPIGRVRRLPMILSSDWEVAAKAERQAINSPVQGMAPDLVQLAVTVLDGEFGVGETARFLGEVHDSAFFEVRNDQLERWLPRIKHVMEHPPVEEWFGLEVPVELKIDIAIGRYWGECSEEAAEEVLRRAA